MEDDFFLPEDFNQDCALCIDRGLLYCIDESICTDPAVYQPDSTKTQPCENPINSFDQCGDETIDDRCNVPVDYLEQPWNGLVIDLQTKMQFG